MRGEEWGRPVLMLEEYSSVDVSFLIPHSLDKPPGTNFIPYETNVQLSKSSYP